MSLSQGAMLTQILHFLQLRPLELEDIIFTSTSMEFIYRLFCNFTALEVLYNIASQSSIHTLMPAHHRVIYIISATIHFLLCILN